MAIAFPVSRDSRAGYLDRERQKQVMASETEGAGDGLGVYIRIYDGS
jgi:hypothetical protein